MLRQTREEVSRVFLTALHARAEQLQGEGQEDRMEIGRTAPLLSALEWVCAGWVPSEMLPLNAHDKARYPSLFAGVNSIHDIANALRRDLRILLHKDCARNVRTRMQLHLQTSFADSYKNTPVLVQSRCKRCAKTKLCEAGWREASCTQRRCGVLEAGPPTRN